MNFKTTILLIALLAVVCGFFWYSQSTTPPPASSDSDNGNPRIRGEKMLTIAADAVNKVIITNSAGVQTQLEKTAGKWMLVSPIKAPTVDWAVTSLISDLTNVRTQGRPQSDPGSDSGLARPIYQIQLSTDDGKNIKYSIGSKTPLHDQSYAQVSGSSDINLVDVSLVDKTLKNVVETIRDKHLVSLQSSDIRQVRIAYNDQQLAMQSESGKWKITSPLAIPGDASAISSLIDSITAMQATQFYAPGDAALQYARFDHPTLTVWLSSAVPSTQPATTQSTATPPGGVTITFGAPQGFKKDQYFAKTSDGLAANVPGATIDALEKTPLDLRDKDVVTINPDDVKEISIVKEVYEPPATQPAATQPTMLSNAATQASTHPSAMAIDATQPATILAASVATSPKLLSTHTIDLVRRPSKGSPILGPEFPASLIPATQPATMPSDIASTMPATMPSTTASASTLPTTFPAVELSVWQFKSDPKRQVDDTKVSEMLAKFQPLHAEKFLEAAPTQTGIERYIVDITVKGSDGATVVHHVEFTKSAAGTVNQAPAVAFDNLNFETQSAVTDTLNVDFEATK